MRAAAVQLTATADKATNLETADRLVRAAARDGASLVVLPEKWSVYGSPEDQRAGAEPLDGPALAGRARSRASWRSTSSPARSPSASPMARARRRNTSRPHRPRRRRPSDLPQAAHVRRARRRPEYRESDGEAPGDEIVLSALADGLQLGLTICYDLRFPELYRRLAVDGARVLAVPAAFTEPTTRDHWEILLRARAIENQAFVVAANQVGRHAPGLKTGGRSMIVDPWGIVLAQAADVEMPCDR